MIKFLFLTLLTGLLQSCTAAAFDRAQPSHAKPEKTFPKALHGKWKVGEHLESFYVDYLEFSDSIVNYAMSAISEAPADLRLQTDTVEIRKLKKDWVFNIAGDGLWLSYILKIKAGKLEVYGFDGDAKQYVARFEEEDSQQGIVFIKYYPTEKEWKKLLKSGVLKKFATFERERVSIPLDG